MPIDLSTNQIIEKNKLSSSNIELLLLEVTYPSEDPIRLCLNNENIVWNFQTWYPALFSLSGLAETKNSEIPSVTLTFMDITRVLMPYIETHNGGMGAEIILRVVDSVFLEVTTPKIEESMEILDCSIDSSNKISFKLGAENLINYRCPQNRYLKNHCRYEDFGSSQCGYVITGIETCNRTFSNCDSLGNSSRFGGVPGVGAIGFMV